MNFGTFLQAYHQNMLEDKKKEFKATAKAAARIQGAWRAHLVRYNYDVVKTAATLIQSMYRRKVVVLKVQQLYDATQFQLRQKFYADMATRIQRALRGYWIRKHILNIKQRRAYLSQVAIASAEQAEYCRQYTEHCNAMEQQQRLEKQADTVKKLAKLNHMRSTAAVPGIFKPNYPVLAPTIGGRPVDEVLKEEARRRARATLTRSTPKILDNLKSCVKDVE